MPTTPSILLRLIWEHPANRDRRLTAIGSALLWQAYKRAIGRPFDLSVYGGLKLRAYPDSHEASRFIYFGGLPDYAEMTFIRRFLRPGDWVIDGGANVGTYTLLAAALVGSTGRVDAFEPAPLEASRLRENVERNRLRQVHVHEAALADASGEGSFTVDRPSGNRLSRTEDARANVKVVSLLTIDSALPMTYTMAKLDLEGAEPLALRGAVEHLANGSPPVLLLELVDRFLRRFGSSAVTLADWLEQRGYVLAAYDPTKNQLDFGGRPLAGSLTNVFAVFGAKRMFVERRLAGAVDSAAASAGDPAR
jgi:FkbM family methyltransferase